MSRATYVRYGHPSARVGLTSHHAENSPHLVLICNSLVYNDTYDNQRPQSTSETYTGADVKTLRMEETE
jgi:hypothetical protein